MWLTDTIAIGFVLMISIVDIVFVVRQMPTFSNRFKYIGSHVSMLPYAWGALGGHFTGWVSEFVITPRWLSVGLLVALGITISGLHWLAKESWDTPGWLPFAYFQAGAFAGVFLVPV